MNLMDSTICICVRDGEGKWGLHMSEKVYRPAKKNFQEKEKFLDFTVDKATFLCYTNNCSERHGVLRDNGLKGFKFHIWHK